MKETIKPNTLIAGFPRCGTDFLYGLLKQHPQISVSSKKEINFFNLKPYFLSDPEILSPRIFKKEEDYFKHFIKRRKIILDFAIMSAYDTSSSKKIKELLGDIKIIFIIRNKKKHQKSIKNLIKAHGGNVVGAKRYSEFEKYITPYKKIFSRVYVTSLEKISKKEGIKDLLKFMEIREYNFDYNLSKHTIEEIKKEFNLRSKIKRKIYYLILNILKLFS
jgi:hypothetical protein